MNAMTERKPKPEPVVQPWAQPYWDAAREHRLVLQYCNSCARHIHYPRIACPHCGSEELGWREASGRGTIYSYTVVEANAPSAFIEDIPYVVAVIRLEEGVQMLSNVVDCDPYTLRCDQPVEVKFTALNDRFTLPCFMPVSDATGAGA